MSDTPSDRSPTSPGRYCAECGAELAPSARFCTTCGAEVSEPPVDRRAERRRAREGSPRLAWIVAGLTLVALVAVLLFPRLSGDGEGDTEPFFTGPVAPAGDARSVDIGAMTPREQADRLFDRVMRELSAGDTAQARAFLPMALDAHGQVEELDADLRYHLAVLHLFSGNPEIALAQSDTILQSDSSHVFGLYGAARAEQDLGDGATAERLYERLLEVYSTEVERDLPEYQMHAPALPAMRAEAEAYLNGRR